MGDIVPISTSTFIYVMAGLSLAVALFLVGNALYSGLRQEHSMLFWRYVKLGSAILGTVGLFLLLLNFEKTVRDSIGGKSRDFAYAEFADLKFHIAQRMTEVCSKPVTEQTGLTCFDLTNTQTLISSDRLRDYKAYDKLLNPYDSLPTTEERKEAGQKLAEDINWRLDRINASLPVASSVQSGIQDEDRFTLLLIAFCFVALSVAGSVGESAYQLARERDAEKQKRLEQEAAARAHLSVSTTQSG